MPQPGIQTRNTALSAGRGLVSFSRLSATRRPRNSLMPYCSQITTTLWAGTTTTSSLLPTQSSGTRVRPGSGRMGGGGADGGGADEGFRRLDDR